MSIKIKVKSLIAKAKIEDAITYLKEVTETRTDNSSLALMILSGRYQRLQTNLLLGIEADDNVKLNQIALSLVKLSDFLEANKRIEISIKDIELDNLLSKIKVEEQNNTEDIINFRKLVDKLKFRGTNRTDLFDSLDQATHLGIIGYLIGGLCYVWVFYFWNEIEKSEELFFLLLPGTIILFGEIALRTSGRHKKRLVRLYNNKSYSKILSIVKGILDDKEEIKTISDLSTYHYLYGISSYYERYYSSSLEHLLSFLRLVNDKTAYVTRKSINETLLILARLYKEIDAEYSKILYQNVTDWSKDYQIMIEFVEFLTENDDAVLALEILEKGKKTKLTPLQWSDIESRIELIRVR